MSSSIKKAFISHSSDDKDRFVIKFAEKLYDNGVEAWVDDWELKPGDSLPEEIFEAIDTNDIFITVLSKNSIESKWVKEELNAGFMKKIEEKILFIPIVIDSDIKIPPACKHLVQVRIKDLNNYDEEFKKIRYAIFGISEKPNLGKAPKYAFVEPISGLEKIDSIILKELGNCLSKYYRGQIDFEDICELLEEYDFSKQDISDSLEILEERNLITFKKFSDSIYPDRNMLTYNGLILYGKTYEENFEKILKDTVSAIVNDNYNDSKEISEKTNNSIVYIEAILECFENNGYIKTSKTTDGMLLYGLTGSGRRNLKKYLE